MHKETQELALQARDQFLARLAVTGSDISSLEQQVENDISNHASIVRFCATLPRIGEWRLQRVDADAVVPYPHTIIRGDMVGRSLDELIIQQASSVYITEVDNSDELYNSVKAPYYVVGMSYNYSREPGQILLAPMSANSELRPDIYERTSLVLLNLDRCSKRQQRKEFEKLISHLDAYRKLIGEDYTEFAKKVFNKQVNGHYAIGPNTEGSLVMGGNYGGWVKLTKLNRLSDQDIASFNVMDHLTKLALAFNKQPELIKAFQNR